MGTGAPAFNKLLSGIDHDSMQILHADHPSSARVVGSALGLSGLMLASELNSLENIRNHFGGGYEFAIPTDDGFRKLDNITYMYWHARLGRNEIELSESPLRGFRYQYREDLLVIRTFEPEFNRSSATFRDAVFMVRPIYRDFSPEELSDKTVPPFDAEYLCNFVIVTTDSGRCFASVLIQRPQRNLLRFTEKNNRIEVSVNGDLYNIMLEQIKSEVPSIYT